MLRYQVSSGVDDNRLDSEPLAWPDGLCHAHRYNGQVFDTVTTLENQLQLKANNATLKLFTLPKSSFNNAALKVFTNFSQKFIFNHIHDI